MLKRLLFKFRRMVVLIINLSFVCSAYIAAFYVRFEFTLPQSYYALIVGTLPALLVIKIICFYYCGLFSGLWKYVSISDIWQVLKANIVASCIFTLYMVFANGLTGFPRSVFILDWGICVALLAGARLLSRALRENLTPRKSCARIWIA